VATLALTPVVGPVARLVPAGAVADVVVVLRGEELLVIRQQPGPAPENLGSMPVADVPLAGAEVVARGPQAVAAYDEAISQWHALTAVALYGLGTRALELGIEYAGQRKAFGILIGTFQALQHALADDVTDLEGARLIAYKAAWSCDADTDDRHEIARMAFLFAAATAFRTASDALHVHGGYGFALEYDAQLYFRRAKAWSLIAGDRRHGYADLAHRLYEKV
jgi:alkylation response protein AidB-like acyl-CoA dehydrogenase